MDGAEGVIGDINLLDQRAVVTMDLILLAGQVGQAPAKEFVVHAMPTVLVPDKLLRRPYTGWGDHADSRTPKGVLTLGCSHLCPHANEVPIEDTRKRA